MHSFVHQYDEEFDALKKERRPGRPASTREDLLRIKIAAIEKEYENGFCQCSDDLILVKNSTNRLQTYQILLMRTT
jgi:translation machinery-associated protein 16